jgi:hypothetical protein
MNNCENILKEFFKSSNTSNLSIYYKYDENFVVKGYEMYYNNKKCNMNETGFNDMSKKVENKNIKFFYDKMYKPDIEYEVPTKIEISPK